MNESENLLFRLNWLEILFRGIEFLRKLSLGAAVIHEYIFNPTEIFTQIVSNAVGACFEFSSFL